MTRAADTAPGAVELKAFQDRVGDWMRACFTPTIIADKLERADRFLEESLELVQSTGYSPDRARALIDYVFGRPVGEPFQEVGGVRVTLSALCNPHGIDEDSAAETELARVWTKIDKIRAKQATKPVGSALPIPTATRTPTPSVATGEIVERLLRRKLLNNGHEPLVNPDGPAAATLIEQQAATIAERDELLLNDIAVMMSEFVGNWPNPKKVSTALALIAKLMRAALNPYRHKFWGAGESDCPRDIKAGNGELHTLRCKVCGEDNPRDDFCRTTLNRSKGS